MIFWGKMSFIMGSSKTTSLFLPCGHGTYIRYFEQFLPVSGWIQPKRHTWYSLSVVEPVQVTTTENERLKSIKLEYTLSGEERSDMKWFGMRCEGEDTWSFVVKGCSSLGSWNKQFLNDIPPGKFKHWVINKTSSCLNVLCNNATVLEYNFVTDCSHGFENGHQIWSKRSTAVKFYTNDYENLILLDTKG
jgi:hypothetical protein